MMRFRSHIDTVKLYLTFECIGRDFCYAVIFTASALYQINVVGLSALQLVLVGTVLEVVYFLFQIPTGIVADIYSRKWSIIIGFVMIGVAFIIEGLFASFVGVLCAMAMWGIGATFTDGALEAWLTDEVGEAQAGQAFVRGGQVSSMSKICGIFFSTLLMRQFGMALPIVLGGGGVVCIGLVLIMLMRETGFVRPSNIGTIRNPFHAMAHTFNEGVRVIRGNQLMMLLTLVSLINGLWSEGFDRLWAKHLIDTIGIPNVDTWFGSWGEIEIFGSIRISVAIVSIGVAEFARRHWLANDQRIARALFLGTAGMVMALIGFAWSNGFWLALITYFGIATLRGPLGSIKLAWVNRQISNEDSHVRATVLSMWSQSDALGQIVGGPLVGSVGNGSLRWAMSLCAIILGTKLPIYRSATQSSKTKEG
jgi:DHA3 family tetracycline resistance protein-like MFS transporter